MNDTVQSRTLSLSRQPENPFAPLAELIADMVVARLEAKQKRLLTLAEAANFLGRSQSWLRGEIATGRIECVREGKSRPRLDREVLERWIREHNGRG